MVVIVLFGGRSGEQEVSVASASSVVSALGELGREVVTVGITAGGRFVAAAPSDGERVPDGAPPVPLEQLRRADVVFPVLHGPYGEDGCVQGLLEMLAVPYVGAGVEGSAIGSNKVLHKLLFAQAGLPVVDFVPFVREDWSRDPGDLCVRIAKLGFPSFVKPARLGSSVGISKLHDEDEIRPAVERALHHDDLVLAEACGDPRELEVGVLEEPDGTLRCSVAGEVVPDGEFYDYRAKYHGEWTRLDAPADVPAAVTDRVHDLARAAFREARCEGLARVDLFYDAPSERLTLNEINTLPGMTEASMFPRVWDASGVPFAQVIARVLDHALARHARRTALEAARAAHHAEEIGSG